MQSFCADKTLIIIAIKQKYGYSTGIGKLAKLQLGGTVHTAGSQSKTQQSPEN
jgi:hypothetical protein